MVSEHGAVGASKRLLADPRHTSHGFERPYELGELHASIEFATARRTCDQNFPPYDGQLENCDEYPFKTTYQGAASDGDFSVKVIAKDDNQEAGSRFGNWYTSDRILDGDSFDISIVD
jgi:Deoxyribonuclease NucA/NucB